MMGFTTATDQLPLTKAVNCLLVVSEKEIPDPAMALACIRCGECANVCPTSLLPQQMYWHSRAQDLEKAKAYNLSDCIECGCCSHVCPSQIPLVQYFRSTKTAIWEKDLESERVERARMRNEARTARLEKIEAEKREKMRLKKEAMKKKKEAEAATKAAGSGEEDAKAKVIEAAKKRAEEKRSALAEEGIEPRNTENLTDGQQRQVDQAEARRQAVDADESSATEEK